ncbi:hypothetical protein [Kribbella solani]|uniref:Uncharacterized protein n=1 Tax=Kribbella solani TaxID=236067 RepID=A0A841E9T5_9ACTN|nr:hypothetical protein [Kribbella solani]MBB5983988.1 hypothetical protein [Kribbella solani]
MNLFDPTTTGTKTLPADAADVDGVGEDPQRSVGDKPDWPSWATTALERLNAGGRRIQRFVEADPEGAFRLFAAAIGAITVGALIILVAGQFLRWAIEGDPAGDLASVVRTGLPEALSTGQIAADALMHWLTIHTTGLPITATTAAWIWGGTGAVIWIVASFHHVGAKFLWPAYGAATAAMAWFGTTTATHRPVTAGLVGIAWTVLALFVLVRRPRRRRIIIRRPAES